MTIEWDSDESALANRGSDGAGLVASYDLLGIEERVAVLEFHYYVGDEVSLDDGKLSKLAQEIANLIHLRLDR